MDQKCQKAGKMSKLTQALGKGLFKNIHEIDSGGAGSWAQTRETAMRTGSDVFAERNQDNLRSG